MSEREKIRFGTDGVRALAYDELTLDAAARIGRAAADVLGGDQVVLGRDTRESGPDFVAALAAGFSSGGVTPVDLGVAPTPAVAHISAVDSVVGAMVSASHNPWADNGIKLFAPGGLKLSDDDQARLESALDAGPDPQDLTGDLAPVESIEHRVGSYVAAVKDSIATSLGGLSVVLDAAHGAGSHIVAPALADLGADVTVIGNQPNGRNINDGVGSTHPEALAAKVVEVGADVGIALDGDADRMLAVDAVGNLVDGDHVIAMCAIDRSERGLLPANTVVVTVMTNLGFRLAMAERGIEVVVTAVGDRYVLEALEAGPYGLGGEQSGHVIFRDRATTGDGFLTAVQLLDIITRSGRSLADLAAESMVRLPQVLRNVRVARKVADPAADLAAEIAAVEQQLGTTGRVLVRASGTEPLVRVMVEAPTQAAAASAVDELVAAAETRYG